MFTILEKWHVDAGAVTNSPHVKEHLLNCLDRGDFLVETETGNDVLSGWSTHVTGVFVSYSKTGVVFRIPKPRPWLLVRINAITDYLASHGDELTTWEFDTLSKFHELLQSHFERLTHDKARRDRVTFQEIIETYLPKSAETLGNLFMTGAWRMLDSLLDNSQL